MPKGKYESLVGKKFNKLLVLNEIHKNNTIYCECLCECGNKKIIKKYSVKSGITKSCGCNNDLTGKKFGMLTVIKDTKKRNKNGRKIYLCRCECGNEKEITSGSLHAGTRSCGCLLHQDKYDNLIGKKFAKLTVIKEVEKSSQSQRKFLCKCECGNEKVILGANLIYGESTSCGCNKGYVEGTKLDMIKREKAYPNSKSGIKGVWQDKKGHWYAIITVCGERTTFYGGVGEKGKNKCIEWRKMMVNKYHKPLIEKYN